MVTRKRVAIIGGGISGIAAAKAFKERGHDVVGFERGPGFGGVWEASKCYPEVKTQSSKSLYRFSEKAYPDSCEEWPTGQEVEAYLNQYSDSHDIRSCFNFSTDVTSLKRDTKGGWTVNTKSSGKPSKQKFDFVAICTGQFSDPNTPTYEGQESFAGEILHSSQVLDPELVRGKKVVVVGGSKSATDLVTSATRHGANKVHLVYRQDVWRIPYKLLGLINFKNLFFTRFQEAQYQDWNPQGLGKYLMPVLKPFSVGVFKLVELGLKAQLSLRKHDMVPTHSLEPAVNCTAPVVTPGFYEALSDGKIEPHRTEIVSCSKASINLANGEALEADLVIQATGWKQEFPFFEADELAKLKMPDGQYHLYRFAVNPDLPDLGFVGANSSFYTTVTSELVANWLVRFADEKLANHPTEKMMRDEIRLMDDWKKNVRPSAAKFGGLCVAPFHYRHFDDLLGDMGASKKNTGPILECVSHPRVAKYADCLKSAPQYQVS